MSRGLSKKVEPPPLSSQRHSHLQQPFKKTLLLSFHRDLNKIEACTALMTFCTCKTRVSVIYKARVVVSLCICIYLLCILTVSGMYNCTRQDKARVIASTSGGASLPSPPPLYHWPSPYLLSLALTHPAIFTLTSNPLTYQIIRRRGRRRQCKFFWPV